MRFLKRVIDMSHAARVPVGVCGEMGGRPLEAMALLGLGLTRLSITPAGVGPVKAMVRSLDVGALAPVITDLVNGGSRHIRSTLIAWGTEHGVELGV
jgi:phosphotransferase system enzyme I (PtsP)